MSKNKGLDIIKGNSKDTFIPLGDVLQELEERLEFIRQCHLKLPVWIFEALEYTTHLEYPIKPMEISLKKRNEFKRTLRLLKEVFFHLIGSRKKNDHTEQWDPVLRFHRSIGFQEYYWFQKPREDIFCGFLAKNARLWRTRGRSKHQSTVFTECSRSVKCPSQTAQ